MEWYRNLYLGEAAEKKKYKFYRKINKRRLLNAYVVALPSGGENVLDIYRYMELLQKHYTKQNIFIVGLACGKDEAMELAARIIGEVYQNTGTFCVSDYIRKREEADK